MEDHQESEAKIEQLQALEQNIQNFLIQKQNFQSQLIEITNAYEELEKTKGKAYKIIGAVMIDTDKEELKKELNNKKETLNIRIRAVEKQENQLKEKASKLQEEVLHQIKPKGEKNE